MAKIKNPILPGFNPDPSVVRVGDDYYIATSTFEWFPGVQIHHSKDLVNWRLAGRVLTRQSQLDMVGIKNSEGVYAPALSYADGKFWLAFSNVKSCRGGAWMATPCYIVSAENIEGPWSEPVEFMDFGFDPSLFHDDDGKKYMVNMIWDGRASENYFNGIVVREFDVDKGECVGELKTVFQGTELGGTEGPQIMKKDGWYYLVVAEGGTGWSHAVTVCRSRSVFGPYEVHPENPILTSKFKPDAPLQRTGHGFFVETQSGEWYLTHLCGRPIRNPHGYQFGETYGTGFCVLGRETAIQKVEWRDDWPYLSNGTNTGDLEVEGPDIPLQPFPEEKLRDDFDGDALNIHFQTLREPTDESWCSLKARPGYLRMTGRHYLYSRYEQSLIARRVQSFNFVAETAIEFDPELPQQMAGLVAYYDKGNYYFLRHSVNNDGNKILNIVHHLDDNYGESTEEIEIGNIDKVYLRVELKSPFYYFSWSADGKTWNDIGPAMNAIPLSDEGSESVFRFTGSMVGICAVDVSGYKKHADFEYFDYKEL